MNLRAALQGVVSRESLVGVGRPLSADAFAPLLRRPGLNFSHLAASARRGGAFLGGASPWGRGAGGARAGSAANRVGGTAASGVGPGLGSGLGFTSVSGGRFDMDAPPLRRELRTECPLTFPRPKLAAVAAGDAKPYLFGGQRPGCTNCNDPAKVCSCRALLRDRSLN